MVGPAEDQYRRELEAVAAGSPLELRFHGTLSHEESLRTIASGDVFALPSHSEGFPNVVAEAMACSRPVLGSAVGAIPDMLDTEGPEPCGVCVSPGDTHALAEALLRLAADGDLRRRMGTAGRRRVETEYATDVVTHRLVALWRELTERSC
jgi:glycosyltransferase involved in cell wall biosynthesis